MKVNMTPNPLDVVTIHASQGDTEARQWEFELHNNGELIDTSDVKEQLVFKAYKGGTEQLLPENGSTPTTSPFKGDIRYPQGLLSDQEFTYRQSPTESDGLAKITDIKGNTLVWNQLVNATDGSGTIGEGVTYTTSNGVITLNGTPTSDSSLVIGGAFSAKANHKYLLKGCPSGGGDTTYQLFVSRSSVAFPQGNRLQDTGNGKIVSALGDENNLELRLYVYSSSPTFSNTKFMPQIFDLTAMGLDSLTNAEILQWFANYFPLSFYSYNQGSLLSFNGNGIKTVGANQWHNPITGQTINDEGEVRTSANTDWMADKILIGADKKLYLYLEDIGGYTRGSLNIAMYGANGYLGKINALQSNPQVPQKKVITLNSNTTYVIPYGYMSGGATSITDVQITLANIDINEYVPYTSSTLSLPISTYFPSGMKSAGNVYDELTETKAITRLIKTTVDGTSKKAIYYGTFQGHQLFYIDLFSTTSTSSADLGVLKSNHYMTATNATMDDKCIRYQITDNIPNIGRIYWNDDRYTSASAMNTALQSDPLEIISLAQTPTESSFTTASLVTENAEIPLSNEDGTLIGKCTEQLSENPGFIDAKIKLTDSDGECYSNKIQLHVERSPQ